MAMFVLLGLLTVVALATPRYGADSRIHPRTGPNAPQRRRPTVAGDLRAVLRLVRSAAARAGQTSRV